MRRLVIAALTLIALAGSTVAPAGAQTFPAKAIRLVVPFAAGSITDIIARVVGQNLAQALGQPVVIDNKPGADGAIAGLEVKRAQPDGYTLLVATNSPMSVVPHLQKQPPYDAIADFTPVSFLGDTTFLIVVHPGVPATSMAEFIAHAKANPRKVNYGTGNTTAIVSTALLAAQTGMDLLHVPYKSEPLAISELVTGQIHLMIASYAVAAPQVRDGKLRALSTALAERTPLLPEVPSIVEAGLPKFPIGPWGAVVGPAKMPADVVERLNKELVAIVAKPDFKQQMQLQGFAAKSSTPAELGAFLRQQLDAFGKAMKAAGIEPQ